MLLTRYVYHSEFQVCCYTEFITFWQVVIPYSGKEATLLGALLVKK
jgi:hypothetical protein